MLKLTRALLCALLVLATLGPISGGKFGGRSSGFGRSGSHSYPSSRGGLSGSGHSGGLSGGGHGYPSPSGGHGYPSSGGLSGSGGGRGYPSSGSSYPSSGGSHGYPSNSGSHGYPSGGLSGGSQGSGKHSYPSGSGLSGGHSQSHNYPNRVSGTHTTHTTINHNYNYAPPKQISYSAPGQRPVVYPVYHGQPPTYVYNYKNSGSKYGTLLAGLALLNLGALGATAYAVSQNHNSQSHSAYKPQPGEYCKFGVKKDNGDYEETRIDCQLITSFILQDQAARTPVGGTNSTVVTTTVTNVTVVNVTNGMPDQNATPAPTVLYQMLPNGTLVPVNVTVPNAVNTTNTGVNGTSSMTVTTTTTNTTVTNALDVKGKEIQVTPGMQCFVMRHSPTSNMRKSVPCGLLQTYADQSIKKNSAARNMPTFTLLCAVVAFVFH